MFKTKVVASVLAPVLAFGTIALTAPTAIAAPTSPTAPSDTALESARTQLLNELNQYRAQHGLQPVRYSAELNTLAQACSLRQAEADVMQHCLDHFNLYPANQWAKGENVASGYNVNSVMTAWYNSPDHKANMLNPVFNEIGTGVYYGVLQNGRPYYTQNFGQNRTYLQAPVAPAVPLVSQGGGNQAQVSFEAPSYNGGSAITSYTISAFPEGGGAPTSISVPSAGTHFISGLTAGITYNVTVTAYNAQGGSFPSVSAPIVVHGAPSVTMSNVSFDKTTAVLQFTTKNGGSPITGYTINLDGLDPISITGEATSHTINNLRLGQSYSGTITATNNYGMSTPTAISFSVPAQAPEVPLDVWATVENKQWLTINWSAPLSDGGSPIESYDVTINGDVFTVDASNTLYTMPVERGLDYTFSVAARNAIGSAVSEGQTITVPFTAPSEPTFASAELIGERNIMVTWGTPDDNGGVELSEYEVIAYVNGEEVFSEITNDNIIYFDNSQIDADTTYSFRISATNTENLKSGQTVTSNVVVPKEPTVPGLVSNFGFGEKTTTSTGFNWGVPDDNGGAEVTHYEVSLYNNDEEHISTWNVSDTNFVFEDLTRATWYHASIKAVNSKGAGTAYPIYFTTAADRPSPANQTTAEWVELGNTPYAVQLNIPEPTDDGGVALEEVRYEINYFDHNYQFVRGTFGERTGANTEIVISGDEIKDVKYAEITVDNTWHKSDTYQVVISDLETATAVSNVNVSHDVNSETAQITWGTPAEWGTLTPFGYNVVVTAPDGEVVTNVTAPYTTNSLNLNIPGNVDRGINYDVEVTTLSHMNGLLRGATATTDFTLETTAPKSVTINNVNLSETGPEATVSFTPGYNGGSEIEQYILDVRDSSDEVVYSSTELHVGEQTAEQVFDFAGLSTGRETYRVYITPVNHGGNITGQATYYEFDSNPVAPSDVLYDVIYNTTDETVELTLNGSTDDGGSDITGYEIAWGTNSQNLGEPELVSADNDKFTVPAVLGSTMYFQVKAVNAKGASEATAKSIVVLAKSPVIENVSPVVSDNDGNATITIEFDPRGGVDLNSDFTITEPTDAVVTWRSTFEGNTLVYEIAGLEGNTAYSYTANLSNGVGSDTFSGGWVQNFVTPDAVESVQLNQEQKKISWEPVSVNANEVSNLRYNVVISEIIDGEPEMVETRTVTDPELFFNGLKGMTDYRVSVTAVLSAGTNVVKSQETVELFSTAAFKPGTVVDVVSSNENGYLTFSWTPGDDGGDAEQEYRINFAGKDYVATEPTITLDTRYTPGSINELTIVSVNSAGESVPFVAEYEQPEFAPSEPEIVSIAPIVPGSLTALLTINAPTENGSTALPHYIVTAEDSEGEITVLEEFTAENAEPSMVLIVNLPKRNETYTITVSVSNAVGSSEATVEYDVPAVAPDAVTGLDAVFTPNNTLELDWVAPDYDGDSEITGYNVSVFNENGNLISTGTTTETEFSVSPNFFAPNRSFTVSVAAVNSAGASEVVEQTVVSNKTLPIASDISVAENGINVSGAVSNGGDTEISYEMVVTETTWKGEVLDSVSTPLNGLTSTAVEFPVVMENSGSTFSVIVRTTNSVGSVESNRVTLVKDAVAPNAVSNVVASINADNDAMNVSFTGLTESQLGGSALDGYKVIVKDEDNAIVKEQNIGNNTSAVVEYNFNHTSTYTVSVVATTLSTLTSTSTPIEVESNIGTPDAATINDTARTANSLSIDVGMPDEDSIGGANPSAVLVTVVVSQGGTEVETRNVTYVPGEISEQVFTGLDRATEYDVNVTVYNGAHTATSDNSFSTRATAPSTPATAGVAVKSANELEVSWTTPADNGGKTITEYEIAYANEDDSISGTVSVAGDKTSTILSLPLNNTYEVQVRAKNVDATGDYLVAAGPTATQPTTDITPLTPTGLDELIENNPDGSELRLLVVSVNNTVITIEAPEGAEAGTWFSGVAHSDPVKLGWSFVNSNGQLTFDISQVPAGSHNIVLFDADGTIVGFAPFSIASNDNGGGNNNGGSNTDGGSNADGGSSANGGNTNNGVTNTQGNATTNTLEKTGSDENSISYVAGAVALLLAGGAVLYITGRRNKVAAE